MSHQLISHNEDLLRLRNEGYTIRVVANHLVVDDIPALDSNGSLIHGRMVCPLDYNGSEVLPPSNHVMHWCGEEPKDENRARLYHYHSASKMEIAPGIATDHQYSAKVTENGKMRPYRSFHEKVETYARIISHGAMALYPEATPTPFNAIPHTDGEESPFRYPDTASSRAGITEMASKFGGHTVAIIGLGGTGSYILDLVAKTPVQSILLFDADVFLQHNAFRSPGAAAFDAIVNKESKVSYLHRIYSEIHKGIIPSSTRITEENLSLLDAANFVFIAIDSSPQKSSIFSYLKVRNVPFIDVGMGISLDDGKLSGQIRTTTGAPGFYSHLDDFVPMTSNPEANDYNTNIQIVELNALNASLAVLRWKKMLGFYALSGEEYHSLFRIRDGAHLREEVSEK